MTVLKPENIYSKTWNDDMHKIITCTKKICGGGYTYYYLLHAIIPCFAAYALFSLLVNLLHPYTCVCPSPTHFAARGHVIARWHLGARGRVLIYGKAWLSHRNVSMAQRNCQLIFRPSSDSLAAKMNAPLLLLGIGILAGKYD